MIRRKKDDKDIIMTPLSELDNETDVSGPEEGNQKKKSRKFPWIKKNQKDTENSDLDSEGNPESENTVADENFDPLNLEKEGEDYHKVEEKKFPLKKLLLIAGVACVAIIGIVIVVVKNMKSDDSGKIYVQNVGGLTGLGSGISGTNRYTGVVEPQDSWKITLDADMSVSKCYVKVGDEVKKGDKLFSYNTEELKLNKEKKELELATLQNEINQLTKDISTYEKDLKGASASEKIELQTQILTAQTTIKKDQFSIKASKEEIEKIKKNIKDATVKSKMDGVVKSINQSLGEANNDEDNGSNNMMDNGSEDNSTYMTILAIGDYRVKGTIKETNAESLGEGDLVIVRSRTDDKTWKGSVQTMKTDQTANENNSNEGMEEGNSMETASNYNFYVILKDDTGLMMGQHVFIEPDNGQDEDREGMWLNSSFVVVDEDQYYIWVDNGHDRLEKRKVEVGEYDEVMDEYQVLSGIAVTDYIASDDMDMREGMKTTKVDPYSEKEIEEGEGEEGGNADSGQYDDFNEGEMMDDGMVDEGMDEGEFSDMQGMGDDMMENDGISVE